MAMAAHRQEYTIVDIWSRSLANAQYLAKKVEASATDQLQQLHTKADLYIIAVPDDYIEAIAQQLHARLPKRARVIHTSGATSLSVLTPYFSMAGVIWPLQSLSKTKKLNFQKVPLCITSQSATLQKYLTALCQSLSQQVQLINEEQKQILHLAAVFANNFTNHMYSIAHELCSEQQVDFELLQPLITETAAKIKANKPSRMQTGPAVRGDQQSMAAHQKLLQQKQDIHQLYQLISDHIQKLNS